MLRKTRYDPCRQDRKEARRTIPRLRRRHTKEGEGPASRVGPVDDEAARSGKPARQKTESGVNKRFAHPDDFEDATEVYGDSVMSVPAKKQELQAPSPVQEESSALISMIERAARDPAVDMDKLERLMQMQERVFLRNAEQAFNEAMSAAQKEIGRIATDAANSQTRSRYATYAAIDRIIRPIYTKHGFALSFDTEDGAPADCVRVVCFVTNGGFTRKYKADMPADGKGAKGGDVMTKTHAMGAGMQYGMRYLVKGIFNIAIGADDDGNAASDTGALLTQEQADEVKALIASVGADIQKFLTAFQIEKVEDLRASKFVEAKTRLANYGKQRK